MKVFAALDDAETVRKFYEKTEGRIKLNYLISYYYLDGQAYRLTDEHKYKDMINELYLDSGAFSVAAGRSKITVTEYSKYLNLFGDRFDQFFNLDDQFNNPEHNQDNLKYLEENLPQSPKKPIPVVHDNENPFQEFSDYVNLDHDYIAIGSTINIPDDTMAQIKEKFPTVKIHLFGKIALRQLKTGYYYSADSTTWSDAAGFGDILYWDPDEKEFHKIYMGSTDRRDDESDHYKRFAKKDKVEAFLQDTFDFEYSDLLKKSGAYNRRIVNLYYYKQLEDYLTELESAPTP
jgi:hypothetical protein